MKRVFTTAVVLSIICIPVTFVYLCFANSTDCSQLVIDTYELHSKINIPEVGFVNCYYDKELNTRISVYDLKGDIDLKNFEIVASGYENYLQGNGLLKNEELPKASQLYLASGERWGTRWTYAIDKKSKRLWAELNY